MGDTVGVGVGALGTASPAEKGRPTRVAGFTLGPSDAWTICPCRPLGPAGSLQKTCPRVEQPIPLAASKTEAPQGPTRAWYLWTPGL